MEPTVKSQYQKCGISVGTTYIYVYLEANHLDTGGSSYTEFTVTQVLARYIYSIGQRSLPEGYM